MSIWKGVCTHKMKVSPCNLEAGGVSLLTERHIDPANKADQIEDKGSATYSFYYT
jgi:hypothetical protein